MLKISVLAGLLLALSAPVVLADPTGDYTLVGKNPNSGQQYEGKVNVVRTGETYVVTWNIGGKESVGTGIGATFKGERFEMGPASKDDIAISVGYVSEDNFGIAMYFEQPDGTWAGVWTYGGSDGVTGEVWTRQ